MTVGQRQGTVAALRGVEALQMLSSRHGQHVVNCMSVRMHAWVEP